jgi:hypothetical protein
MSYESQAALSTNDAFRGRVFTCCKQQAMIFKDDTRREFFMLANQIIAAPNTAEGIFQLVVVHPNYADVTDQSAVEDNDIMGVVQAVWPVYGAVMYPEVPAAP